MSKHLALSIRQPWAWLIINCAKDVENRDWPTRVRGNVLIHAAKTMTHGDYEACVLFMDAISDKINFGNLPALPSFAQLQAQTGGIVGHMNIEDCVTTSPSPWFCGRYGFVLGGAGSLEFRPCKGRLGFFPIEL